MTIIGDVPEGQPWVGCAFLPDDQARETFPSSIRAAGPSSNLQLFFAPFWGRWSDRIGRRPMIIIGIAGYAIAQVLFGLANSLWLLYAAHRGWSNIIGGTAYRLSLCGRFDHGQGADSMARSDERYPFFQHARVGMSRVSGHELRQVDHRRRISGLAGS